MIRFCSIALVAFSVLIINASLAQSYLGGPATVTILGWDAQAARLYFLKHALGGTGNFGEVRYFDLTSEEPDSSHRAEWSVSDAPATDPVQMKQLTALKRRLEELEGIEPESVFPEYLNATLLDSVETPWGKRARYELRVHCCVGLQFSVEAYGREFVITRYYRIPDRDEFLIVVVFRGNPKDSLLAETHVPVMISERHREPREVVWKP